MIGRAIRRRDAGNKTRRCVYFRAAARRRELSLAIPRQPIARAGLGAMAVVIACASVRDKPMAYPLWRNEITGRHASAALCRAEYHRFILAGS